MRYALKISWRHLSAAWGQTALLVSGVAVGVFVFVFMSALIGGLGRYLVLRTVGDISHVTISAPARDAGPIIAGLNPDFLVRQRETGTREIIRSLDAFLPEIEAMPEVEAASPQITGNGFAIRGQSRAAVAITGVMPERVSAISDLGGRLVAGNARLDAGTVLIGTRLAEDLGLSPGQVVTLQSDRDQSRSLTVAGVYEMGVDALDQRAAFVSLAVARTLFDLPQGHSKLELRLYDLWQAEDVAEQLAGLTGLQATSWQRGNAQLLQGLQAQEDSGNIIKGFALITIMIGVASALLLSGYRRQGEIGIMRTFGASKGFIVTIFMVQGTMIGLMGGLTGAGLGYALLSRFPIPQAGVSTGFPIDYTQGAFLLAIGLTTLMAMLASVWPALSAARVDPVEVIGQ